MKKQIFTLSFALCTAFGYSQIPIESSNSSSWPTSGKVGIGTSSPSYKLHVLSNSSLNQVGSYSDKLVYFGKKSSDGLIFQALGYATSQFGISTPAFRLQMITGTTNLAGFIEYSNPATTNTTKAAISFGYNEVESMRINQDGKVRIGSNDRTTPNGYRLFVEEGILTEKVKVALSTTADWADYVFASEYKLMPLNEVEKFTKENNHLPNVPSATEMVNNGLDVAKMDAKLLEKIEELTLYTIDQNKTNQAQAKEIKEVKTTNDALAKEVAELKAMMNVLLEKK